MDNRIDPCDSDETRASCWLRHTVYALLVATGLLALIVALAVETVGVTPRPRPPHADGSEQPVVPAPPSVAA